MIDRTIEDLLNGKCIFCGYNGPNYWLMKSHDENCPFYKIGGIDHRVEAFPGIVKDIVRDNIHVNNKHRDTFNQLKDAVREQQRLVFMVGALSSNVMSVRLKDSDIRFDVTPLPGAVCGEYVDRAGNIYFKKELSFDDAVQTSSEDEVVKTINDIHKNKVVEILEEESWKQRYENLLKGVGIYIERLK